MLTLVDNIRTTNVPQVHDELKITVASCTDKGHLLATLTSAFINDPPSRWLYPDPDEYLRYFPSFAYAFRGGALNRGTA